MTKLRRCSPEIERELHDLEARIRELEGALHDARHFVYRCLIEEYAKGAGHNTLESLVTRMDSLLATSPPDSEPAEGAGGDPEPYWPVDEPAMQGEDDERTAEGKKEITEKSHALEYASRIGEQGAGDYAYSRGEDARLDKHLIERGAIPEWGSSAYTPSQRRDTGDALREKLADPETMQRVTERAAERQDAMLERREDLEKSWDEIKDRDPYDPLTQLEIMREKAEREGCGVAHQYNVIRQALSRTSDEGTGCVVPEDRESALWLMARIIERHVEKPPGPPDPPFDRQPEWVRKAYYCQAERAIAEQGEQRTTPVYAVPEAVRGLLHSRNWQKVYIGSPRMKLELSVSRDEFYRIQSALAAAPQPEHGESDE